ncbi:MAG: hypothetical protein GY718_18285 [Lentisphaerae bacterium]|nr:hypothetical protein [Lentisphaerota bacterium]
MDIKKTARFLFFTMLFAVQISGLCCSDKGVSVHVQNSTESELDDIILEFTGDKRVV